MSRARVLLADDHTLVLEGLRRLLESEFDLVGAAEDGIALVEAAARLKPDVVLMDIAMPLLNGMDAARQLKKTAPSSKVIFVTMHPEPEYVRDAFRAGAWGYVLKRSAAAELVTAIREVVKGRYYVTPLVTRDTIGALLKSAQAEEKELTPRQRQVLQLVAEGRSNKQITAILGVSPKTVEFHKAALMRVLNLHSTAELTRYAVQHGLVK